MSTGIQHRFPKVWMVLENNIANIITITILILSLGIAYGKTCANLEELRKINEVQELRLAKLEEVFKVTEQVRINTKRLDALESFMLESARDRAAINAKLDAIKEGLVELTKMHTKP